MFKKCKAVWLGFIMLLFYLPAAAVAADSLDKSRQVISQTNQTLQGAQKKINQADDQTLQMVQEYKTIKTEIENYLVYNGQLKDIIASQKEEMSILQGDIDKIESTGREIMPFMQKMIDGLTRFIDSDYPFLLEERSARLDALNANMKRADLSIAAKYRQILEAYQIELDYGNTIEAYEEELGGKKMHFLKLGRIGLYYLSLDQKNCAAWDMQTKRWRILNDMDYKLSIAKAIKIAKKQRAPELIFAAVEQARSRQ